MQATTTTGWQVPPIPSAASLTGRTGGARLLVLFEKATKGDEAAFEELYTATAPWLLGRLRVLAPAALDEELLLDVYCDVWQRLQRSNRGWTDPFDWLACVAQEHVRARRGAVDS